MKEPKTIGEGVSMLVVGLITPFIYVSIAYCLLSGMILISRLFVQAILFIA